MVVRVKVASFVRALHHHYPTHGVIELFPRRHHLTRPFSNSLFSLHTRGEHPRPPFSLWLPLATILIDLFARTHIRSHQFITQSNSSSYSISVRKVRGENTHHNFVASFILIELTCCFISFCQFIWEQIVLLFVDDRHRSDPHFETFETNQSVKHFFFNDFLLFWFFF